ncbi:MAG: GNAT family N-acetyltransferase [Elusimicrobia bacterium]|nr:GNAT family N-acetyltransferase [Elusimicrobiota bacterium]
MSGSIRLARPGDLDALLALQAAWPGTPPWTRAHFAAELDAERGRLLVFDEGLGPEAFAALRLVPPESELTLVAVRPDRLRRGLARRLLERIHDLARAAGCASCALEVSEANGPARALYASLGYRVVGRRPKYYNDASDAVLMALDLLA